MLPHWLDQALGLHEGVGYHAWSGIIAGSAVLGAAGVFVWRNLCTERRCWRPARRRDGAGHLLCYRHWRLSLPKPALEAIPVIRESWERLDSESRP